LSNYLGWALFAGRAPARSPAIVVTTYAFNFHVPSSGFASTMSRSLLAGICTCPLSLDGPVRDLRPVGLSPAIGESVYCLNFVVIRSTASFTSAPALSM
jgi:hypothetical protein